MSYDHWKTTNPEDAFLGPQPCENCGTCRYWSELIAHAHGDGEVEALCESAGSPNSRRYTVENDTCRNWERGP